MKPYFEFLDLPVLPQHLEQEIRQRLHDPESFRAVKSHRTIPGFENYHLRQLTQQDGVAKTSVFADRYHPSDELVAWVLENIHPAPKNVQINITNQASDSFGPHVDFNRSELLLYVLDPGGSNVLTTWWQQHGHPVHRPEMQDTSKGWAINCDDYSQLTQLTSVCIPPHTWIHFCDTSILHSVENLETTRLTIQIPIR